MRLSILIVSLLLLNQKIIKQLIRSIEVINSFKKLQLMTLEAQEMILKFYLKVANNTMGN